MLGRRTILFLLFLLAFTSGKTQTCNLKITGVVIDKTSQEPLSYVNVAVQEMDKGDFTDDQGWFKLSGICEGHYHLTFTHIGCEPVLVHLDLYSDTLLHLVMDHSSVSLESIVIQGSSSDYQNQSHLSIGKQAIEDNSYKNLSTLLEKSAGVAVLKNGSGIAKPVVHGLFGNRLPILNNGIAQSGQQWGNDHSPEIDPLAADKITVIKGASALEYFGGNLGSLILVEPKKIGKEPHLHGRVNYAFETNGRGHNLNLRMEQGKTNLGWRINGTLKKYGDRNTPNYFLRNTGSEEANLSVQLEKSWKENWFVDIYASTFNAQLAVLRGAHIGNLTDLESALSRSVPFFTEPDFTYNITPPRQTVGHHLLKLDAKKIIDDDKSWQFVLAGQYNDRKEFDNRRNGRSEIPVLSLEQWSYTAEAKYNTVLDSEWALKLGSSTNIIENANRSGTGIRPLIPNYVSYRPGLFVNLKKSWNRTAINTGINTMYEHQRVVFFNDRSELIRENNNFLNLNAIAGVEYKLSDEQQVLFNLGLATRNPAINELYSAGLHQGVSGIEEGDPNLDTEQAVKTTLEYKILSGSSLSISSLFYYQRFWNFINLTPQEEFRLTIRGAFPVFKYEQSAAQIYGFDFSSQLSLGESLIAVVNYSFIKGDNLDLNQPLVNIPSNSLFGSLTYNIRTSLALGKMKIEDFELELNNRYVFMQDEALEFQDFTAPPAAYNLVGIQLSSNIMLPNNRLRFHLSIDNLLDVNYRDYLNRLRYFADENGLSLTVGLNLKF